MQALKSGKLKDLSTERYQIDDKINVLIV